MLELLLIILLVYVLYLFSRRSILHIGGTLPDIIYFCPEDVSNSNSNIVGSCRIDPNTDYFGNTYKSLRKNVFNECCEACKEDLQCQSWTYDKREQICRLKTTSPTNISPCTDRVSGIVIRGSNSTSSTIPTPPATFSTGLFKTLENSLKTTSVPSSNPVTIYNQTNFLGESVDLFVGQYNLTDIGFQDGTISSLRVAPGYRLTLFNTNNFTGNSRSFTSDSPDVSTVWNEITYSIQVERTDQIVGATIFKEKNYLGDKQEFLVGRFNSIKFTPASIRVSPNFQAILVSSNGNNVKLTGDSPDISNMTIMAISIEKFTPDPPKLVASVYTSRDFGGTEAKFPPGRYNLSDTTLSGEKIQSLSIQPGYQLILYRDPNFTGPSRGFTGIVPFIREGELFASFILTGEHSSSKAPDAKGPASLGA